MPGVPPPEARPVGEELVPNPEGPAPRRYRAGATPASRRRPHRHRTSTGPALDLLRAGSLWQGVDWESTPPTEGVNRELTPSTQATAVVVASESNPIRRGAGSGSPPNCLVLTSVTTRAHPSVRALALLLAERIASDILQEHVRTAIASAVAEHGQPGSGNHPLLEEINPCKTSP